MSLLGVPLFAARVVVDVTGLAMSLGWLVAAETTPLVVSAIGAAFVFGGLLARLLVKQQAVAWEITEQLRDDLHYSEWEKQQLRFTYGERALDPGPYVPRRKKD